MLYGNYCYIFIGNFPRKFFPCVNRRTTEPDRIAERSEVSAIKKRRIRCTRQSKTFDAGCRAATRSHTQTHTRSLVRSTGVQLLLQIIVMVSLLKDKGSFCRASVRSRVL